MESGTLPELNQDNIVYHPIAAQDIRSRMKQKTKKARKHDNSVAQASPGRGAKSQMITYVDNRKTNLSVNITGRSHEGSDFSIRYGPN